MKSHRSFVHDAAPTTRLPMRGQVEPSNCCACRDCDYGPGPVSRSREKREWRRGIIVPRGRVRP